MTSVQFLHFPSQEPYNPPEWGTGKHIERIDPSLPRNATWRYSGEPVKQFYGLTKLKLSNVRTNDELVPRPQSVQVGKHVIKSPFPAEHPYGSHIPHFAVFPKFDSPEDPKRGVAARNERPISSEMPANPAHTTVVQKIKGFPYRHEYQEIPLESEKTALYWPGEEFFDQETKLLGEKKQYFPYPPKTICPNLQQREGDMKVSPKTANALRNVEREQWMTSYDLHYTGLGPSNPVMLDNLEEKTFKHMMTGKEDDKLYQHFISTLDPPRPVEGRIPSLDTPLPLYQKAVPQPPKDYTDVKIKMTPKEKEEHRLLYGADYVNLPVPTSDPKKDTTWQELDKGMKAGPALERIQEAQKEARSKSDPYEDPKLKPDHQTATDSSILAYAKKDFYERNQQMEASDRFKDLELQTPARDRAALNYKMEKRPTKDKPAIFYGHEGRYNEERAGLYKTSYDPHSLTWSMQSAEEQPNELQIHHRMDNMMSLNQPGGISLTSGRMCEDNAAALKWSRTFSLHQPELSGDRRDGTEILTTYKWLKDANKRVLLPPPTHLASPRVQERELIETEDTTMGNSYNTVKFLQDHALTRHQRSDSFGVMTAENQDLNNVRERSILQPTKNVQFNRSVTVATEMPSYSGDPVFYRSATMPLKGDDGRPEELPAPSLDTEQRTRVKPFHYTRLASYPLPPVENSAAQESVNDVYHASPGAPVESSNYQRKVHFTDEVVSSDDNNNAASDINNIQAHRRFRSFPRRSKLALHGHGLLDSEYTDQFCSLSTNFMPSGVANPFAASSSYQSQFPNFDLGFKTDACFDWKPGSGIPRPQSCLIKLQDTFIKTDVLKKFHQIFPETNPELRFNVVKGRRHEFGAFNAQVLHG